MSLFDLLWWSLRQIRKYLLESMLIILGIGLGIAVICSVVGVVDSVANEERRRAESIRYRRLNITSINISSPEYAKNPLDRINYSNSSGMRPYIFNYQDYLDILQANLEGIKYVWLYYYTDAKVTKVSGNHINFEEMTPRERVLWQKENTLSLKLVSPQALHAAGLSLVRGDFFRHEDIENGYKVAILGDQLAKRYFGEKDPIGQTISLEYGTFKVIGVVHREPEKGEIDSVFWLKSVDELNKQMYIPAFSYPAPNMISPDFIPVFTCLMERDQNKNQVYFNVKNYMDQKYGEDRIGVSSDYYKYKETENIWVSMSRLVGLLAGVALLIASINILNLVIARVLRRYQQIGMLEALGASRRNIFSLFLMESLMLALLGSILGIVLAVGVLPIIQQVINIQIMLTPLAIIIGVGITLLVTMVFGLYPAYQAAQIQPVDALRAE